jgi:hypothetical protein
MAMLRGGCVFAVAQTALAGNFALNKAQVRYILPYPIYASLSHD